MKHTQVERQKSNKRMPVWMLIITDILLTLTCLGVFTLYHLVIPRQLSGNAVVVATVTEGEDTDFELPGNSEEVQAGNIEVISDTDNKNQIVGTATNEENNEYKSQETENGSKSSVSENTESTVDTTKEELIEITNYGNSDTLTIEGDASEREFINSADKIITEINSYGSNNIEFTTNKVEIGSGTDKITYYISDIYVTNVNYIRTAFADGEYGKNLKAPTLQMTTDNNALLAINGDFYGNNEIGVVIRNGVLYRTEIYDADICVLFTDGTMKTYSPEEFDVNQVLEEGAWQAWIFGPELLDGEGNVLTSFNSTYYLSKEHPRTAIGYVAPGHYVFLVVDGRDLGYSRGVTLSELGQIMADAGCLSAYNLDGGKSSAMAFGDTYVNQPFEGGRAISDIIYVGE